MRNTAGRSDLVRAHAAVTAVLITTLSSVGCSTAGPSQSGDAVTASDAPSGPSGSQTAVESFEAVRFTSDDGVELSGRLWGDGSVGVILAHGFSEFAGQDTWLDFPAFLAEQGYATLTFTFRGFCDRDGCTAGRDLGANWRDILAAVDYLEGRGVGRIFLIGGSMGGLAVLRAAEPQDVELAGVVSLSTPQWPSRYYLGEPEENDVTPERLTAIEEPKLFIAGTSDIQLPGSAPLRGGIESVVFAEDARAMFEAASEPKHLELIESRAHSSELVTLAGAEVTAATRNIILDFLETYTSSPTASDIVGYWHRAQSCDELQPTVQAAGAVGVTQELAQGNLYYGEARPDDWRPACMSGGAS
jgi:pimeloyl-ACP methyl ester carboxylesterase